MVSTAASKNASHFICYFSNLVVDKWDPSFSYYLTGPCLSFVIVVGLIGNLLSLLTLTKPKNRLPQINQYLIALSLWDTALISSAFFVFNLPILMYGRNVTHGAYVLAYPLCFMLSCASHMGSIWMVMTSAVDRYFALCRPLTHRYYVGGGKRTKTILILCSLTCLVYNAPRYLEMSIDECYDSRTDAWTPTIEGSGLRSNQIYWICYKIIGDLLFFSALPFAALTYLSIRVIYEVRRLLSTHSVPVKADNNCKQSNGCKTPSPTPSTLMPPTSSMSACDKRVSFNETVIEYESRNGACRASSTLRRHSIAKGKKSGDDPQQALNIMLVAVLLKFLVCHSLPAVLDVWESITMDSANFSGPVIDGLVDASNFLVVVNSSVNVFIYICCSRRFRFDMVKVIRDFFHWWSGSRKKKSQKNNVKRFENGGSNYRQNTSLNVCDGRLSVALHASTSLSPMLL